jgi:hypothetical protein
MRWQIKIDHLDGDVRLMTDVLKELSLVIDKIDEKYILSGPVLESLDTPSAVHDYAKNICEIAAEVEKYNQGMELGFSFSVVIENSSSGVRRHHFVDIKEAVTLSVTTHAATIIYGQNKPLTKEEIQKQEEEKRGQEYQERRQIAVSRFVSAVKNERALTVQRLLSKETTPQVLGHIADIIQEDLGNGINSLATKKQLSRFYRSINHPDVYGEEARHIVSRVEPPPDPMTLPESTAFIREITRAWLILKAGMPNA